MDLIKDSKINIVDETSEITGSESFLPGAVKRLGRDTLSYIPAALIPAAVSVVGVVIFTRIFAPSEYGQYEIAFATVSALIIFVSYWIHHATVRYRGQDKQPDEVALFNRRLVLLLAFISLQFVAFASLVFVIGKPDLGEYAKFFWPCTLFIAADIWFLSLAHVLLADLRSRAYSFFIGSAYALRLAIAVVLTVALGTSVAGLFWGMFIAEATLILPLLRATGILARRIPGSSGAVSVRSVASFARRFALYGFPVIGWLMGTFLLNVSDRYLIGLFRGSTEVGIYGPNYSLAMQMMTLAAMPLILAAHPLIMRIANSIDNESRQLQSLITSFSRYYLLFVLPFFAFVCIFSREFASIIFGRAFQEGYTVIPLVLLSYLAWNFAMYGHKAFEVHEQTTKILAYVMICTTLNIGLNFFFIPRFGYFGAAITSVICLSLYPVLVYFGARRVMPWIIPWRSILRISLAIFPAATLIVACKLLLPTRDIIKILVGFGLFVPTYVLALLLVKELSRSEMNYLKSLRRRSRRMIPSSAPAIQDDDLTED
jgi:O-antigen/teichoic acid export membrane protein